MKQILILTVAAGLLVGCGSSDNTTEAEKKAFKEGKNANVQAPPAGAMAAPTDFKSSINDGPSAGK